MIDIKVQQGVPALYLRGALAMCERQQHLDGWPSPTGGRHRSGVASVSPCAHAVARSPY
jgi:hypothetical protein